TGGGISRNTVEMDHFLDTPENEFEQVDQGTMKIEPYQFEFRWVSDEEDSENHQVTMDLILEGTPAFFRIAYPSDDNFGEIVHGFLSRFGNYEVQPFEHLRVPVTLEATGKFYWIGGGVSEQEPAI